MIEALQGQLAALGFAAVNLDGLDPHEGEETLLERALRTIPLDFDALPLLCEGESKILRLWTDKVVVERFKPTVYSFTMNRYGLAEGTEAIRVRFTAEVFRRMAKLGIAESAFLALIESEDGPLLVQRLVDSCNVETRIKRYHIGSPVHRYRYTERHGTAHSGPPLARWTRFEQPAVCFDWRHPLRDEEGRALADEPLPDDYAAVWIDDVPRAKEVARSTFLWLEELFAAAGAILVDMCIFIDATGRVIYGEISPDCMRVRIGSGAPEDALPLDKDVWRQGRRAEELRDGYERLMNRIFGPTKEEGALHAK